MQITLCHKLTLWVLSFAAIYPVASIAQDVHQHPLSRNAASYYIEPLQYLNKPSNFNVLRGEFTPHVIRIDRTEPVIFEVTITGSPTTVSLEIDGEDRPMYDDGTHGDAEAGDGIYTVTIQADEVTGRLTESDVFRPFVGYVNIREGDAIVLRYNVFAEIWTPSIPLISVDQISPMIQVSPNLFNIKKEIGAAGEGFDPPSLSQEFYQWFNDDYDFIHFLLVPGYRANRHHISVQNTTQGLGLSDFDNSSAFGSAGRLKGYNVFPIPYFFDGANNGFIHEAGHQWINFLSGTPLASGIPHWPFSSVASGVMGFSIPGSGAGGTFSKRIDPEGDGFRVTSDSDLQFPLFNNMELYLMGLLSLDKVEPILVFNDQSQFPADGLYPASAFTEVSIEEIISVVGVREPGFGHTQVNYNVATIVVSDELLTIEEMSFYDYFVKRAEGRFPVPVTDGLAKGLSNPFFVATGERATLHVSLDASTNMAPVVENPFEAVDLIAGGASFVRDLKTVFNDADGDVLNFSASSDNESVVTAVVSESILTVAAIAVGSATITVNADDGRGGMATTSFEVSVPSGVAVERVGDELPKKFALEQNYPNPFNPRTTFTFDLPRSSTITLKVYDMLGREAAVLASGNFPAGHFETVWDATGHPSGVYVYRLEAGSYTETKKLVLQR